MVNAHGWFSYEVAVKPLCKQNITVTAGSSGERVKLKVTVGDEVHSFDEAVNGKKEFVIPYEEKAGNSSVRVRFDRIDADTPYIYLIEVK